MMRFRQLAMFFSIVLLWSAVAHGEMIAVSVDQANIRETPKINQYNLFIQAPRYYPLKVLGSEDGFYQVRDYRGQIGWISRKVVDDTRAVVVKVSQANIRGGPGLNNKVVLRAERGVCFKVLKTKGEWMHLEHASGRRGWMHQNLLWGG